MAFAEATLFPSHSTAAVTLLGFPSTAHSTSAKTSCSERESRRSKGPAHGHLCPGQHCPVKPEATEKQ